MWPTDNAWANALVFAAAGYALVLAAAFGSLLGQSSVGARCSRPHRWCLLILVVDLASALLIFSAEKWDEDCIYSSAHPSDCNS